MRALFPGYFRPTDEDFAALWGNCTFAIDANVLLNLYRYSPGTRRELEKALDSVKDRLFIPHQAAKEFLKNRLSVTTGQAEEYTRAVKVIKDLTETLSNRKKHPFLPESEHQQFVERSAELCTHLETQRTALLDRLTVDEVLAFVEQTFDGKTGEALPAELMKSLAAEGDSRYQQEVPPGYKDGKKDASGDPYRKYGDLIVWKQIINRAKAASTPIIFITDDKKEDWWQEQSGRTIGPRPELVEEFIAQTAQKFWMYSVDKFVEETGRVSNVPVSAAAIAEIVEVREDAKAEAAALSSSTTFPRDRVIRPVLSEEELLVQLKEFLSSHPSEDGSVGLKYFVVSYLGSQNYEINHSYARLNALNEAGKVDIFQVETNGVRVTRVKLAEGATHVGTPG